MKAGSRSPHFHPSYLSNFSIQQLSVIILAAAKQKAIAGIKQRGSRACSRSTETAAALAKVLTGNVLATSQGQKTPPCCTCFPPSPAGTFSHTQSSKERSRFRRHWQPPFFFFFNSSVWLPNALEYLWMLSTLGFQNSVRNPPPEKSPVQIQHYIPAIRPNSLLSIC